MELRSLDGYRSYMDIELARALDHFRKAAPANRGTARGWLLDGFSQTAFLALIAVRLLAHDMPS